MAKTTDPDTQTAKTTIAVTGQAAATVDDGSEEERGDVSRWKDDEHRVLGQLIRTTQQLDDLDARERVITYLAARFKRPAAS